MLKGGEYLRVWIAAAGNQYLIHLPPARPLRAGSCRLHGYGCSVRLNRGPSALSSRQPFDRRGLRTARAHPPIDITSNCS